MSFHVKNIVENFRAGEYSFQSALYMLEALMPSSEAEKVLRGLK